MRAAFVGGLRVPVQRRLQRQDMGGVELEGDASVRIPVHARRDVLLIAAVDPGICEVVLQQIALRGRGVPVEARIAREQQVVVERRALIGAVVQVENAPATDQTPSAPAAIAKLV